MVEGKEEDSSEGTIDTWMGEEDRI